MTIDVRIEPLRLVAQNGVALSLEPLRGLWTEEQYLALSDYARYLVEFSDGSMEILPMPTKRHQLILLYLYRLIYELLEPQRGLVIVAPLRMQIRPGKYREPDLLLLLAKDDPRGADRFWSGADLVIEVVSPDDPERDTVVKRADYAEARIPEYWIVNPEDGTVTVLTLSGVEYAVHGVFSSGQTATSALIAGLAVNVAEVLTV